MSTNSEVAKIFREIAFILQTAEEKKSESTTIFKIRSYNRAADEIENLYSDIGDIYKKEKLKGLLEIPSIGKAIATKLEEYITTGKIHYYDELKEKLPVDVSQFFGLEGSHRRPASPVAPGRNRPPCPARRSPDPRW